MAFEESFFGVEARGLTRVSDHVVLDFLFEEIFAHYEVPREIVTYGGAQFISQLIHDLFRKYRVHHKITWPYHPQANG